MFRQQQAGGRLVVRRLGILGLLLGVGLAQVDAQTVLIQGRPLTPQDLTDYSLTNLTQGAAGGLVVHLGGPAYLEALVTKDTVVTQVVWSLDSKPGGSASLLTNSPLGGAIPTYDPGDTNDYDVAGRQLLVPDVDGLYVVSVDVMTDTNGTVSATNTVVGSTYIGASQCGICHATQKTAWDATGHAVFFATNISGYGSSYYRESCISCHTVGYDTTPGAVNGGFDDITNSLGWAWPTNLVPTNWTGMDATLQAKANIQCENCHGPGNRHFTGGMNKDHIDISLSAGNCGQCHDAMTHHYKNLEWKQAAHGRPPRRKGSSSCGPCHTTVGFVKAHDADYTAKDPRGSENEGITCVACHDPHADDNPHQIRQLGAVTLSDTTTVITNAGMGQLCMQCHKSRRDAESYIFAQLGSPSSHFGPHYGTQADMLAGSNAIHYGMAMPSGRHLDTVADTCTHCHMPDLEDTVYTNELHAAGGHTFWPAYDNDTPEDPNDDVDLMLTCNSCHGSAGSFDFGGEDYDRDGKIEGVQHEIHDMLDELAMLLPPVGLPTLDKAQLTTETNAAAIAQLRAAYNYGFVKYDGSYGVHNAKYAAALLRASLDDMQNGIDNDRDGLLDSFEITYWGSVTSQTANADADGDGVINSLEQAVGTDPTKSDTDGDTISDLGELQIGTDPLDIASTGVTHVITMRTALELAYLPGLGETNQFQFIDSLGSGGAWSNIGSTVIGAGSEMRLLVSTTGETSKFYRVVSP